MPTTREIIQSALEQNLIDGHGRPVQVHLLPGLTQQELDNFARSLPAPPPDGVRDLLQFCSGMEGTLEQVDFTGRTLADGFGLDFLIPQGLPLAHDGSGNFWVIDLDPEAAKWGPVYYCCHDAPVMLVQAATVHDFVSEIFKRYRPPYTSLIDAVCEDRLFRVWRENPGVLSHADAGVSVDPDIRAFAAGLNPGCEVIDLRNAPAGMGFSWGRYGPHTEVRRFGAQPIFAYCRPQKTGLLSRLLGRYT
jgi:hypothetical protein